MESSGLSPKVSVRASIPHTEPLGIAISPSNLYHIKTHHVVTQRLLQPQPLAENLTIELPVVVRVYNQTIALCTELFNSIIGSQQVSQEDLATLKAASESLAALRTFGRQLSPTQQQNIAQLIAHAERCLTMTQGIVELADAAKYLHDSSDNLTEATYGSGHDTLLTLPELLSAVTAVEAICSRVMDGTEEDTALYSAFIK